MTEELMEYGTQTAGQPRVLAYTSCSATGVGPQYFCIVNHGSIEMDELSLEELVAIRDCINVALEASQRMLEGGKDDQD